MKKYPMEVIVGRIAQMVRGVAGEVHYKIDQDEMSERKEQIDPANRLDTLAELLKAAREGAADEAKDTEENFSFVDRKALAEALAKARTEAILLDKTTQVVRSLGRSIAGLRRIILEQEELLVDLVDQLAALVSAFESAREEDRGVNKS